MTAGAMEQPRRHELAVVVLLAFAISWAMHIPWPWPRCGPATPLPPPALRSTC